MVSASTSLILRCAMALIAGMCSAHSSLALASDLIFEDGFEVALGSAFFVSPQGLDTNPGTKVLPFQTINKGIATAATDPVKKTVVVAGGTYSESISLVDGVSLFGQYQTGTWTRDPANDTVINGAAAVNNHLRTVTASNIASATTLDGFVIYGAVNATAGGNSYAIYISASSANLRISNNVIYGGRGGPGAAGPPGTNGSAGVDGAAYSSVLDSFTAAGAGQCSVSNNRTASGGGTLTCGTPVNGGNGGGNNCTPAQSTQNSTATSPASAGTTGGGTGDGSGGTAGTRGYDAALNGSTCFLPISGGQVQSMSGGDGSDGGSGASAVPGASGCVVPAGNVAVDDWMTDTAASGSVGANGGGGGGGGAGGGAACTTNATCKDMLGGHGGGGGSGACGGSGGNGGSGGGGAFDIFVVGGTAPIIRRNTLFLGDGGDGGNGGDGGVGGLGGDGSQGGQTGALFCTGQGGRGGNGGTGGHGSGGGGGCGGASVGIYTSGAGTPDYCTAGNNIGYGGFAGSGGAGGASLVSPGGAGQTGIQAVCSFN